MTMSKNEQYTLGTLTYYKFLSNYADVYIKYRSRKNGVKYVYDADICKALKSKYFTHLIFYAR